MRVGSTGPAVRDLTARLRDLEYETGGPGRYDERTATQLRDMASLVLDRLTVGIGVIWFACVVALAALAALQD